jgi:mono/diheme cytochrome c family protein
MIGLILALGCTDPAHDTGIVAVSPLETPGGALLVDGGVLYAVDALVGELSRLDPEFGALSVLPLGGGPTRLVGSAAGLYSSLRGCGELVAVADDGGALREVGRVSVGGEPAGLALSPDGATLYAALSMAGEVVALDAGSLSIQRRWSVAGEPRWLALSPDGEHLIVAPAYGDTLSHIDLTDGAMTDVTLPEVTGQKLHSPGLRAGDRRALLPRISGDPGYSADGATLAVPLLLVDVSPEEGGDTSYADEALIPGSGRFSGAVLTLPTDGGMPDPAGARLLGIRGGNSVYAGAETFFGSYPSATVYGPDGVLWVPMEGSRVVVTLDADTTLDAREADGLYFTLSPMAAAAVDAGPSSVALWEGAAFAYSFLDQNITALDVEALAASRAEHAEQALAALESEGLALEETLGIALPETIWLTHEPAVLPPLARHPVSPSPVEADLQTGMRLFYTANDGRMSGEGADVSCATCHAEGRTDGQTWSFTVGARQTPSLTGGIGETAPFTWASDVESIADEARNASVRRMGGVALSTESLSHIEGFVAALRPLRLPAPADPDAVARGAVLFDSAGCGDCHQGPTLSDDQHHDILDDVATNTPTLRGIAATAPYLHDGSAPSLRDVLLLSDAGEMGDTAALTEAQRDDLIAYLRSL